MSKQFKRSSCSSFGCVKCGKHMNAPTLYTADAGQAYEMIKPHRIERAFRIIFRTIQIKCGMGTCIRADGYVHLSVSSWFRFLFIFQSVRISIVIFFKKFRPPGRQQDMIRARKQCMFRGCWSVLNRIFETFCLSVPPLRRPKAAQGHTI